VAVQPSHAEPRRGRSRAVAPGIGGGGFDITDGKTKSADFGVIVEIKQKN
jgi:hypothetical protein